jgi:hypothetical protein
MKVGMFFMMYVLKWIPLKGKAVPLQAWRAQRVPGS